MCGRVILTLSAKMIEMILNETLDINQLNIDDFVPRYNVGPGQDLVSVIQHKNKNRAGYMKWQFIPTYAQSEKDGYQFVNARSETIHEKVSFKDAFERRRCLVICNGFYEWDRKGDQKVPYFFHHDMKWMALGGIWNPYIDKKGEKQYGFSLITTAANKIMAPVHHRMPVILETHQLQHWLSPDTSLSQLQQLMLPIHDTFLETYPVSDYVNKIAHQDKKCIERTG